MSSIAVKPTASGAKNGVDVSDLMSGVTIVGTSIKGELKNYTANGWAPGTWPEDEQTGHYLVLDLASTDEGETIQTMVEGGKNSWVTVTDGYCIYHLTDTSSQKIKVKGTIKGETSKDVTYGLKDLTLAEE